MIRLLSVCAALLALAIIGAACHAPIAPGTPTPPPTPIISSSPQQTDIQQAWAASKHAATFVAADDGANNICARCHSPNNWTPTDPDDMPATCASCKFTIKTPKPVARQEWKAITCEVCHRVDNNVVTDRVAFLNTAISQFDTATDPYEDVKSNRELCEKCHTDARGFAYSVDLGSGPHSSFDCTRCHDPHSIAASCTAVGCHPDALKPPTPVAGHDAAHASVACSACHDAAGLKVGPTDDKKTWTTWRAGSAGGKAGQTAYVSHNLQRKVDCARCHFARNPWGIAESVTAP